MTFMPRNFGRGAALHGRTPLTIDQLGRIVPSAFAADKHESRSERYSYIPTSGVIEALMGEGFQPFGAKQGGSRIPGKREFTKHMIRFRHGTHEMRQVGDTVPEVVLINSHDGTSRYIIMAGLFRLVCLNGMIVPESLCGEVRIGHTGNVQEKVIEGTWKVVEAAAETVQVAQDWSGIHLTPSERTVFAEAAHEVRFGGDSSMTQEAIKPADLLRARRGEDQGNDLWRTFNRVQENATKGGLTGMGRTSQGQVRRVTTRPVGNIDGDVKLNRALMTLAAKMAELKAA